MDCCRIQDKSSEWDYPMSETSSLQLDNVNQNIQNIIKHSLDDFVHLYNKRSNQELLVVVNWSEDSPHTQKEIDQIKEDSRSAKDDANQHIENAWEAFGNYNPGTVIKESIDGWRSLRESERLEKEAVHMENSNICHYENERE